MSVQDIRAGTGRVMPELGANPIEVAFQDYQRMAHELALATQEHAQKTDMVNDLLRENEFLRRNYDKAVAERDRYQALAVNLATRAVSVREAVERLLTEAMNAGASPARPEREVAVEAIMGDSDLKREFLEMSRANEEAGDLSKQVENLLRGEVSLASTPAPNPADWYPEVIAAAKHDITRRTTLAPNEFR